MITIAPFFKNFFFGISTVSIGTVLVVLILAQTPEAHSAVLPYFGGNQVSVVPCTCSGGTTINLLDYGTNTIIPLIYQPGVSKLYLNQNIYGTFLLGSYTPGGGSCWMAGSPCWIYPTGGIMNSAPGTGTSL